MPFSSGTFSLFTPGNPVVTGTTIASTWANNTLNDLATGLSTCLLKDGSQTVTANIPLNSFKLTGIAVGTALTDSVSVTQLQSTVNTTLSAVAGTNTITGTASPTPAAYASGQAFEFTPANTNTGAATINISGLGAKSIFSNGAACVGNELVTGVPVRIKYDGTQFNIIGSQVRGGIPWAVAGGTADAITATYSPVNASLYDGLILSFRASAANATTTPTFAPDSLTAHTIVKAGGSALNAGDIAANLAENIVRYNLANTRWELLNPANAFAIRGTFTATLTGVTTTVTGTANYTINGNVVTVNYPPMTGTSNTTSCTITGQPAAIQPTTAHNGFSIITQDNSATAATGRADVGTNGVLTLFVNSSSATFTNVNVKGLIAGCTITYNLN